MDTSVSCGRKTHLVSDAHVRRLGPTRRRRFSESVLVFHIVRHGRVIVKVCSIIAPDVATAADKGDVEGFTTPRGHCRHGEREGKSDDEDY